MRDLIAELTESVVSGEAARAKEAAQHCIDEGMDPYKAITEGLAKGMRAVGEKFEKGEYFVPEMMRAANAMKVALEILEPRIELNKMNRPGRAVVGTVRGDIHDIGKNLICTMLRVSGFEVHDLGVDVPSERFVEKVRETNADLLLLSALTTSTRNYMREVIELFEKKGMRQDVKVVVGGATVSKEFAEKIGADGYAKDAKTAIEVVINLMKQVNG